MKKIFFLFLTFSTFSLVLSREMNEKTMKEFMQKAEKEERKNMPEALKLYAQIAIINVPDIPYYDPRYSAKEPVDFYKNQRTFIAQAIDKIAQEAARLKQLGKYNEASKFYQYASQIFPNQITALKKIIPFENQIKQAIEFASKKNFTQAYAILDNPQLKNLPDIIKLKMSIRNQEEAWKTKQAKKSEQKEWIFLRKVNRPDKEATDWRIKSQRLELNAKAADAITTETFVNLIKEAKKSKIPYILIGLRDNNDFYYFFDGSLLPELYKNTINPITKAPPKTIDIFVAGDDEKLTFLQEIDVIWKIKDYFLKIISYNEINLNENLQKSGYGQFFIANLFKNLARGSNTQAEVKNLQEKIKYLIQESEWATEERVLEIFEKVEKLSKQIEDLEKSKTIPAELQHARQWYEWALEHLPGYSTEYTQATNELNKLNALVGPKILPQEKPKKVQETLMQNLQNLTRTFKQLSAKLVKLE